MDKTAQHHLLAVSEKLMPLHGFEPQYNGCVPNEVAFPGAVWVQMG